MKLEWGIPLKLEWGDITSEDIEDVLLIKQQETFKLHGELRSPSDIVIDDHLRMIRSMFKFLQERKFAKIEPVSVVFI